MTRVDAMRPMLVEAIPDKVEPGIIYISQVYGTAVHKCCCGCGQEVVTPLGSTDWQVSVTGNVVSVYPSVGNWSFPCRSHYWIEKGRILWAEQWSQERIEYGRRWDQQAKQRLYGEGPDRVTPPPPPPPPGQRAETGFWAWLWRWITGR